VIAWGCMSETVVQLKIAGQSYRVVSSATTDDLARLAHRVEEAVRSVTVRGRQPSEQDMVLASITLAHEVEQEREARQALERRYEAKLRQLLAQVDAALAQNSAALAQNSAGQRNAADSADREPGRAAPTLPPPSANFPGEELDLPFAEGLRVSGSPELTAEVYVTRRSRELGAMGSEG
jgi:cell division protein ZapA